MVYFDESGIILGQLPGHYGMSEIYTHLYASFFLFFASITAVAIIYRTLNKSKYSWPVLLGGIVYVGLIGLGEGLEHLPFLDPYIQSMAHYLHLISAPIAVFTLYLGMKETVDLCKVGPEKAKLGGAEIGMGIFAAVSMAVIILGYLAHTPWNEHIEGPVLLMIFLPTLFFVGLVIWESRHFAESTAMLYLPILSIAVSVLTLDIWIGRFADVQGYAGLYIFTHAFQDAWLGATGAMMLLFALHIWYSHLNNRLFLLGVSSREEATEPVAPKPRKKDFRVDEQ
jgi:hypothetical protein